MLPPYYEYFCPVKIVSGKGSLSNLPHEMDQMGVKRALVVTDQGVVGAGLLNTVKKAFEGSDAEIGAVYDQTPPDSSNVVVNQVAKLFNDSGCDCIIAVGGGSAIDTAKGVNIVITEGTEDLLRFQGAERLKKPTKPFIAIPTTAGTGSEVTVAAVITNVEKNVKMAFSSYQLFPKVAILDPKMTMTMPPKITAATGMDALTHAVEAYYCLQKNPISDSMAVTAIKLIMENLEKAIDNGKDEDVRMGMANGALLAGIAFSNAMVGVVHSLAHACGGIAHIPHGVANAILLPVGIEHNLNKRADIIAEMAPLFGVTPSGNAMTDAKSLVQKIRDLIKRLHDKTGMPSTLKEAGVPEDKLPMIAELAIDDGTMIFNPEETTREEALELLKRAY